MPVSNTAAEVAAIAEDRRASAVGCGGPIAGSGKAVSMVLRIAAGDGEARGPWVKVGSVSHRHEQRLQRCAARNCCGRDVASVDDEPWPAAGVIPFCDGGVPFYDADDVIGIVDHMAHPS